MLDPLDPADGLGPALPPWLCYLLLLVPAMLFARWVRSRYRQAYQSCMHMPSHCGLTGLEVARRLLETAGLRGVRVLAAESFLTSSRYHPLKREVVLAQPVHGCPSLASLAVAAHEVGHALQYARGHALARLRLVLVPVTYVCVLLGVMGTALGIVEGSSALTWTWVAALAVGVLFPLVTVPLEFDASARGRTLAAEAGILQPEERAGVEHLLRAAGRTYVATAVVTATAALVAVLIIFTTRWDAAGLASVFAGDASIWVTVVVQCLAVAWLARYRWRGSGRQVPGLIELNNRANQLVQQGKLAEAVTTYTQAVQLHPRVAQLYANRGETYARAGRLNEALADLDAAIRLEPRLPLAYACRAQVHCRLGRYDAARADYDRALQLAPAGFPALVVGRADVALARGDVEEAIRGYTEALKQEGNRPVALCSRSLAWLRSGDLDRALADAEEAIRLEPGDAVAYNNRGVVFLQRGEYVRALADLQTAIALNATHPNAYKNLAWLQATCPDASFRDGRAAVANASRALELSGGANPEWLDILAAAHAEAGNFEAAVRCQEECLAGAPPAARDEQAARLELYRAGRPFRDQPASATASATPAEPVCAGSA